MRQDKFPTVPEPDPKMVRFLLEFGDALVECGESMRVREGENLPCDGVFIPCQSETVATAVLEALFARKQIGRCHLLGAVAGGWGRRLPLLFLQRASDGAPDAGQVRGSLTP